jgi:hypothetical protein
VVATTTAVVAEDESCGVLVACGGCDVDVDNVAEIAENVVQ